MTVKELRREIDKNWSYARLGLYNKIIGAPISPTIAEIKTASKKSWKKYHPDKNLAAKGAKKQAIIELFHQTTIATNVLLGKQNDPFKEPGSQISMGKPSMFDKGITVIPTRWDQFGFVQGVKHEVRIKGATLDALNRFAVSRANIASRSELERSIIYQGELAQLRRIKHFFIKEVPHTYIWIKHKLKQHRRKVVLTMSIVTAIMFGGYIWNVQRQAYIKRKGWLQTT